MSVVVNESSEFSAWLSNRLVNSGSDTDSVVDYVFSVLSADAGSGEPDATLMESAKDIIENFELCQSGSETESLELAEQIVSEFKRLCVSEPGSGAGSHGNNGQSLSSIEAEALAKARGMTVQQRQPTVDKHLILQACANIDTGNDDDDDEVQESGISDAAAGAAVAGAAAASSSGGDHSLKEAMTSGIDNRRSVENEEKLKRERLKLQHAMKVEKDKMDREKQKKSKEARKEAEKKRTQKQERRK